MEVLGVGVTCLAGGDLAAAYVAEELIKSLYC